MKIISKHKDYYDGVQSIGLDKSTVYQRRTEIIDVPTNNGIDIKLYERINSYKSYRIRSFSRDKEVLFTNMAIVGFCGYLYECYTVHTTDEQSNSKIKYLYTKSDIVDYLKSKEKEYHIDDLKFYRGLSEKKRRTMDWTEIIPNPSIVKGSFDYIFHEINKPIFFFPSFILNFETVKRRLWIVSAQNENQGIVLDPILKSIEFHKQKDAYTCYQDIEQYLNGVLGNTELNEDKRSDIEKIRSHGFDVKYGFRKRKE